MKSENKKTFSSLLYRLQFLRNEIYIGNRLLDIVQSKMQKKTRKFNLRLLCDYHSLQKRLETNANELIKVIKDIRERNFQQPTKNKKLKLSYC